MNASTSVVTFAPPKRPSFGQSYDQNTATPSEYSNPCCRLCGRLIGLVGPRICRDCAVQEVNKHGLSVYGITV